MYQITAPVSLHCAVDLPTSKSLTNRLLLLNALSTDHCRLYNMADCDDSRAMQRALKSGNPVKDLGAAGTALRFLTAYYAMTPGQWTITGSERMKHRPIGILVDALRSVGATIEYLGEEGYPPLSVTGHPLPGGAITIDGSVSSQYLSALMMIAPLMENGLEMKLVNKVNSRPYLDMTVSLMRRFGVAVLWRGAGIKILPQPYKAPSSYVVEKDWSAASYWYELASLYREARIRLSGLKPESLQGDARVQAWFSQLGVLTEFDNDGCMLFSMPTRCEFFDEDLSQYPDMAQTLAVTLALKGIPFRLRGLESLRIKETDRLAALVNEMDKLGFDLKIQGNDLLWRQKWVHPCQQTLRIDTYQDHRMAMAFAPVAACLGDSGRANSSDINASPYLREQTTIIDNQLIINNPDVISKSYPDFWQHLSAAGFRIKEI